MSTIKITRHDSTTLGCTNDLLVIFTGQNEKFADHLYVLVVNQA